MKPAAITLIEIYILVNYGEPASDKGGASETSLRGPLVLKGRMMRIIFGRTALARLLAAFFVFGGLGNIFASASILDEYHRWGYPNWFHYVTGSLESTTAVLLALPTTRLIGSGLGSAVMAAAAGTLVLHGEPAHAVAPLAMLVLLSLNAWMMLRAQRTANIG